MLIDYLKPFFAFAVNRTGNACDAQELAQEIVTQVLCATAKTKSIENYNGFVWSVAHNTYKRWLSKKKRADSFVELEETFGNILRDASSIEDSIEKSEEANLLHRELSLLTKNYRKAIVHYYYDGLTCSQIADKLDISPEMVKFYLFKGRQKLREGIQMPREYGEKSYNPAEFHLYKTGWSTIDPWSFFTRKLPGNIALIAYEKPIGIGDMSLETGVPATFLEDEVKILVDAGLLREVARDTYQTNFFVGKKEMFQQIKAQIKEAVEPLADGIEAAFQKALPEIKSLGLFKFDIPEIRYKWLFMQIQNIFDIQFSGDYPQILSDGSRNFIWGEETEMPPWSGGYTPYSGDGYTIGAVDIARLGSRHQDYLRNKGAVLTDIALGRIDDAKTEDYARLVKDGYAIRCGDTIYPNIPVMSDATEKRLRQIVETAVEELKPSVQIEELLTNLERAIKPRMTKIVQGTPREYASLILSVHIESDLLDAMYLKGYTTLPEEGDNTPMTSYLVLH